MLRGFIIIGLICLTACKKDNSFLFQPVLINPSVTIKPPVIHTWLALGDSYTIGQSVQEADRYPAQTVTRLKENGIMIDTLRYIATSGWSTQELLNALSERKPYNHTIVSLLIGVNDQYRGIDSGVYRKNFREALGKAIYLANGKKQHVFVISIPDYSITPYCQFNDTTKIRKELEAFNAINKDETSKYGCPYLDITPSSRMGRTHPELIAADGLHFSGIEYWKWARDLAPLIENVLK